MNLVQLHKPVPCEDVAQTLRRIADEVEAGKVEWPITTAVLVFAHLESRPDPTHGSVERIFWRTYGFGPRRDSFTCRGVLAEVIHNSFSHEGDAA